MLEEFLKYIERENLFDKNETILLAVSGGIDSIVLSDLFYKAGFKFAIAHCNFNLRGSESDGDEMFVRNWAQQHNITLHQKSFDTEQHALKNNYSTQMSARELRYQWFEELMDEYGYSYTATAHHHNDQIETFFMNVIRGTGIAGLHGIAPKKGRIIRPLLFIFKDDVEKYAKDNNIEYREDSSNRVDKYKRNKIRLRFFPLLKDINPGFEKNIIRSIEQFKEAEIIFNQAISFVKKDLFTYKDNLIYISIEKLLKLSPLKTYLYEFIVDFNFNSTHVDDIIESMNSPLEKNFYSNTHHIIKDRSHLIILPRKVENESKIEVCFEIQQDSTNITTPIPLQIEKIEDALWFRLVKDNNIAYFDYDKLKFPLILRKWKDGDFFFPFGMNRSKKKISSFFKDMKFSPIEKEDKWLLCSGDDIIWVVGHRTDERYKITNKTKSIYKITCENIDIKNQ